MTHALKPACPICGNAERTMMHTVEANAAVFRVQCEKCKTIYFDRTPPTVPKYDLAYNKHFFRPGDIRKAGIMAALLAEIAAKAYIMPRILEAGTGNGLTAFLLNEMGIYTEAVDMDDALAIWLKQKYKLHVHVSRFEDYKPDFDWTMIYSSHVIEHAEDPLKFLKKARSCLVEGGMLFMETPDVRFYSPLGERWHHFKTRNPYEHRFLFGQPGMYLILSQAGFRDIRIESVPDYQILRITALR